jgi:hypothetical protein
MHPYESAFLREKKTRKEDNSLSSLGFSSRAPIVLGKFDFWVNSHQASSFFLPEKKRNLE